MATSAEKEQIIRNLFQEEYTENGISIDGTALNGELTQRRRNLLNQFPTSGTPGDPTDPPKKYYSDDNPSRRRLRRGTSTPSQDLASYTETQKHDGLYTRARNSYIAANSFGSTGAPNADAIANSRDNSIIRQPDTLFQAVNSQFQDAVRTSNLGSVVGSEFEDAVEYSFGERLLEYFGQASFGPLFDRQEPVSPTSQEGIYQIAVNNFIWTYYAEFQLAGGQPRSAPRDSEVFDQIRFEEIVNLFVRIRVREALLAAINDVPEGTSALLADPTADQNSRQFRNARELLRQETLREAEERFIPEDERGSQENQSQLRRLAEQAFLIDYLPEFADQNQKVRRPTYLSGPGGAPYFSMIHGRTDTIVNRMIHNPALQEMDTLRPAELAGLVPKIRLFKVFPDSDSALSSEETDNNQKTYIEQEVPFDNYIQPSEIESMMSNAFDRGRGVGLQSFDWRLEGRDPFTSRRDIFAELKLYFQSFDEILRVRRLATSDIKDTARPFRYVDLVNIGVVRQTREGTWNPDYYKLRVEVGWQDPGSENSFLGTRQERERKRNAILNSKMVMYLTAIDHTIDVNDQGNVTMNISYVAWQEASYLDQDSDVLATDEVKDLRLQRRAAIDRARKRCDEEEVNRIVEEFKKNLREERLSSYQKLLRKLVQEQRVFYVPVPVADLDAYVNYGENGVNVRYINTVFNNARPLNQADINYTNVAAQGSGQLATILGLNTGDVQNDNLLKKIQDISYDPSARDLNLQYFYFGDLIKVAIEQASNSSPPSAGQNPTAGMVGKLQKDLRILLGPISFKRTLKPVRPGLPAQTDFVYNINLADIPISVNFFGEWFLKQAVSEQRNTYPILVFIRDLANKMLSGILRNQAHGLGNVARQNLQLRSNFFSAAAAQNGNDIIQDRFNIIPESAALSRSSLSRRPLRGFGYGDFTRLDVDAISRYARPLLRPPNTDERAYHYMLVYAINTGATERLGGDYAADNERGIYHFGIGRDRGIFKSVKFSKTDLPFLREGRFQASDAEAAATGLTILANVYEIEVKMFGNTMFAPGMKIFLNPSGIAPMLGSPAEPYSPASLLGIGGYHVVTGVRSYIQGGKFETTMKAIFEASGARGALGFSGAEQTAGREERCPEELEARNLSDSSTPVAQIINDGPRGND